MQKQSLVIGKFDVTLDSSMCGLSLVDILQNKCCVLEYFFSRFETLHGLNPDGSVMV